MLDLSECKKCPLMGWWTGGDGGNMSEWQLWMDLKQEKRC